MKTIHKVYVSHNVYATHNVSATTFSAHAINLSGEIIFPPLPPKIFIVEGENETECFNKIITFFKTLNAQFDGEVTEETSDGTDMIFRLYKVFPNGYCRRTIRVCIISKIKDDEIAYL